MTMLDPAQNGFVPNPIETPAAGLCVKMLFLADADSWELGNKTSAGIPRLLPIGRPPSISRDPSPSASQGCSPSLVPANLSPSAS